MGAGILGINGFPQSFPLAHGNRSGFSGTLLLILNAAR
jgi:hypothetical protein